MSQGHTLKAKETVEQLAKAHKLDVREIWTYPENAKLAAQRKTADKCQPGDVVVLPPSKSERQASAAKLDTMVATLQQRSTQIAQVDARLQRLIAELDTNHAEWVAGLTKLQKTVKDQGDMADMANTFIGFGRDVKGFYNGAKQMETLMAAKAKGSVEAAGKIKALDKEIQGSVMNHLYGPFSPAASGAGAALATAKGSDSAFADAVGTLADFYGKLTSPSGWAEYITHANRDLQAVQDQLKQQYAKDKATMVRKRAALAEEKTAVDRLADTLDRAAKNIKKGW